MRLRTLNLLIGSLAGKGTICGTNLAVALVWLHLHTILRGLTLRIVTLHRDNRHPVALRIAPVRRTLHPVPLSIDALHTVTLHTVPLTLVAMHTYTLHTVPMDLVALHPVTLCTVPLNIVALHTVVLHTVPLSLIRSPD